MKFITKNEVRIKKNGDACEVEEYGFEDPVLDIAIATIRGRYPEKGFSVNVISKECIYILEGTIELSVNDKKVIMQKSDAAIIDTGEKYFLEGVARFVISCSPSWSPDQHRYSDV